MKGIEKAELLFLKTNNIKYLQIVHDILPDDFKMEKKILEKGNIGSVKTVKKY